MAGDAACREQSRPVAYYLVQDGRGNRRDNRAADARCDRNNPDERRAQARSRCRHNAPQSSADARSARPRISSATAARPATKARRPTGHRYHTAALRKRGGCFDSDNNSIDFSVGNAVASQLGDAGAQLHVATRGDSRHPGDRRDLAARGTGRDHRPASSPRSSPTASSSRRRRAVDSDPATSEGCSPSPGVAGRRRRQRRHGARNGQRVLQPDAVESRCRATSRSATWATVPAPITLTLGTSTRTVRPINSSASKACACTAA